MGLEVGGTVKRQEGSRPEICWWGREDIEKYFRGRLENLGNDWIFLVKDER